MKVPTMPANHSPSRGLTLGPHRRGATLQLCRARAAGACLALAGLALLPTDSLAQFRPVRPERLGAPLNLSLRLEAETAIRHATLFLQQRQSPTGAWGNNPVVTSLVAVALVNAADGETPAVSGALDFIRSQARPGGGIASPATAQYEVYSTALAILAPLRVNRPADAQTIRQARDFLLATQQLAKPTPDAPAHPLHGGFAPTANTLPDLTTTQFVVEALYLTEMVGVNSPEASRRVQAALRQAVGFIAACQAPPSPNGAVPHAGGFFHDRPPGDWPETPLPGMPRSRAFLTCVGLRSLLYAGAGPDTRPVREAVRWLNDHLSMNHNPDLGEAGYYTYVMTVGKTMRACEVAGVDFADQPNLRPWRNHLARALLARQAGFGTWRPGASDWWENNPELATVHAASALNSTLAE